MTRAPRARRASAGVTLIELAVVLAILATVTVFALPAMRRGSEGLQLRAGAARVVSLLREARQQAVTHRRPTRVAIESGRRTAVMGWESGAEPLRRVELPERFHVDTVSGPESLTFSSRGIGRDARWVVEGPSGRRLVVAVHGVTGRVTVAPPAP